MSGLAALGVNTLPLDVTDGASMAATVEEVIAQAGSIDILINNAGYGLYGPVEQLPMDEIRRLFETNFFGLVRLTQLVLPHMRTAGQGRILNVSSMGGRTTLPGGAFYHASKHAVESLSDALRDRGAALRYRRRADRARAGQDCLERRCGLVGRRGSPSQMLMPTIPISNSRTPCREASARSPKVR